MPFHWYINLLVKYDICTGSALCTLLLWMFWDAGSTAVILKQTFQTSLHRMCQRDINITLLLWRGAFVESLRSSHKKNNPPEIDSCVGAGGLLLHCGTNSSIWKEKPHFNYACVQMRGLQCWLLCLHMHRQQTGSVHYVFKDLAGQVFLWCHTKIDVKMENHPCMLNAVCVHVVRWENGIMNRNFLSNSEATSLNHRLALNSE